MKQKVLAVALGAAVFVSVGLPLLAGAQVLPSGMLTVPTSTQTAIVSSVSNIFGDLGVLGVLVLAAAIPLFFYVAKQLIGMLPHSRGTRK
jgi:hypothetical protein